MAAFASLLEFAPELESAVAPENPEALRTRLILQVHDELVFEAPDDEVERLVRDLPALMTSVATLRVPLKVDVGRGRNWDEAH